MLWLVLTAVFLCYGGYSFYRVWRRAQFIHAYGSAEPVGFHHYVVGSAAAIGLSVWIVLAQNPILVVKLARLLGI